MIHSIRDIKYIYLSLSLLVITACGHSHHSQQTVADNTSNNTTVQDKLLHYWDNFPYDDQTVLSDTALMQRVLGNWLQTMQQLPDSEAQPYASIAITAGYGRLAGQKVVFQWLETLLNNPNSPYRNEELFISVLEAMTQDSLLSELDKERPRFLLAQAMKNRKGTKAADITFITKNGEKQRLYDIQCGQILLYFFNPDCHDCKRVGDLLRNDAHLNSQQAQGRLQVVAIYPDEDLTGWEKVDSCYPANWIIGRALPGIKDKYNLPAIPSVYILDSNHIVLVKDAPM